MVIRRGAVSTVPLFDGEEKMGKSDYDRLREYTEKLERENAAYKAKENEMIEVIAFYSQLADEYEKLNKEMRESKAAFEKARFSMLDLKAKYQQEMDFLLRETKEALA